MTSIVIPLCTAAMLAASPAVNAALSKTDCVYVAKGIAAQDAPRWDWVRDARTGQWVIRADGIKISK